jgi:hypothetical protein
VAASTVAAVAGLAAWCGWVSGFHRRTPAAEITWVISLVAVVAVDGSLFRAGRARAQERGRPPLTVARLAPWLLLAVAVITWDTLGLDTGPHEAHLTISALTQAFRPLNASALMVWILLGIGYGVARWPVTGAAEAAGTQAADTQTLGALAVALFPHGALALWLPGSRAAGVGFWLSGLGACAALELLARRHPRRLARAGDIVRGLSERPLLNSLAVLAWVAGGFHLFCI